MKQKWVQIVFVGVLVFGVLLPVVEASDKVIKTDQDTLQWMESALQYYFTEARSDLIKGHRDRCAYFLRLSRATLTMSSDAASGVTRERIETLRTELTQLADQIEAGGGEATEIDRLAGQSQILLAQRHYDIACQQQSVGDAAGFNQSMASMGTHLKDGAVWTGKKTGEGLTSLAESTKSVGMTVGSALADGTGAAVETSGQGIQWIGTKLNNLGQALWSD